MLRSLKRQGSVKQQEYILFAAGEIMMNQMEVSKEKKLTMMLLCYFFGCFGVHRFYTGKIASGILMLLTLGCVGIWMFVDLALIIMGKFTDKEGRPIIDWV